RRYGVGIVGCGNISGIYFKNCAQFENLKLVGCADTIRERAKAKGAEFGVPDYSVAELMEHPAVEIVLNLTVPRAHAEINLAALQAGKNVYTEKPLGVNRQEGRAILDLAFEKGLRVGAAPDTFLGAGLQTCRKLIDHGTIGK